MKSKDAEILLNSIDSLISNLNRLRQNILDPLENSYLAGFLLVFICGTYEETIETILKERVAKLNDKCMIKYVSEHISNHFRNPSMNKVKNTLERFDKKWSEEIEKIDSKNKMALDNIVNNKNGLAHGKSTTNLSIDNVIKYYEDSRSIIEKIDDLVL
jgi:hypothetical protein